MKHLQITLLVLGIGTLILAAILAGDPFAPVTAEPNQPDHTRYVTDNTCLTCHTAPADEPILNPIAIQGSIAGPVSTVAESAMLVAESRQVEAGRDSRPYTPGSDHFQRYLVETTDGIQMMFEGQWNNLDPDDWHAECAGCHESEVGARFTGERDAVNAAPDARFSARASGRAPRTTITWPSGLLPASRMLNRTDRIMNETPTRLKRCLERLPT